MKAELTFRQLWYNPSILGFFFRSQSERTLNELMDRASVQPQDVCDIIEEYAYDNDLTMDDIEEMFYSFGDGTLEELAEEFGIEISEEE